MESGRVKAWLGIGGSWLALLCMLALVSCPNPIDESLVTQIADKEVPSVTIEEPADRSEYSTQVRVSGTVNDGGDADRIASCRYRVVGTSVQGSFQVDGNGAFSFYFPTREPDGTRLFDGPVTLEVIVTDWSGNETVESLQLLPAATGDVPGFTVTPGNKQAVISWNEVPGAESYSLFEAKYGLARNNVSSPYTWEELENGEIYEFQLTARMADGTADNAVSASVETMPLSPRTFAPWVREVGYKSITIEWRDNPNVSEYTVERSLSPDGPWEVRRNLTDSVFTDTRVDFEKRYYYRVYPSYYSSIVSTLTDEVPGIFPTGDKRRIGEGYNTQGSVQDLAVTDDSLYIADGYEGLQIFDISNPIEPIKTGSCSTPTHAYCIAVDGSYAYIADSDGLRIIDISTPSIHLDIEGECNIPSYPRDIEVKGEYAYLACGYDGLQIIDISSPSQPELIGEGYQTYHSAEGLDIVGNYAYVAFRLRGLLVIDISNPTMPIKYGNGCDTPGSAYGVTVEDKYAYIADEGEGLQIVDLENLSDPHIIGEGCDTPGYAEDVVVSGNYAYVADYGEGIQTIDITDPSTPFRVGVGCETPGKAETLALYDDYAYIADSGNFQIVDISDPLKNANLVNSLSTAGYAKRIEVSGNLAFVVDSWKGLYIMDISNPFELNMLYEGCETPGSAYDVVVSGKYAYIADVVGLQIIDISNPTLPSLIGDGCDTNGNAFGVELAGDYAYVADGEEGLQIIDISDPFSPQRIGEGCDTPGIARDVVISGNYAYVADGSASSVDSSLQIIDISNPKSPIQVGNGCILPGDPQDIDIVGSNAYIACNYGGLQIVDISDVSSPKCIGSGCSTPGYADGVAIDDSYAYVADGLSVQIVNITDTKSPVLLREGFSCTDFVAFDIEIAGNYALAIGDEVGLQVIDLTSGN
jgi:hypothetical protein